ncbi:MAG: hypothetical protein ACLS61_21850 [Ruminococcus sp.]
MITPGVERVDTIKTEDGYEMKSIWCRSDLSDTSMMKLSTATGYIYGYVQNLETGMWQYIILDFETGETVLPWMLPASLCTTTWLSECMPETAEIHFIVLPVIWNF